MFYVLTANFFFLYNLNIAPVYNWGTYIFSFSILFLVKISCLWGSYTFR